MTTTSQTAASKEVRPNTASPRLVVWVDLPNGNGTDPRANVSPAVHDPSALYEECERWDGMA